MKILKKHAILFALLLSFLTYSTINALSESATTVAAIQLPTTDAGNFVKMRELVRKAKLNGADLVIFPEESVFGWLNPDAFLEAAPIPGKYSNEFAAIARDEQIWLAAGLAEQGPEAGIGSQKDAHYVYNSGILINPEGQIVLHHRQFNVIKNSFDPSVCQQILNQNECSYMAGDLSDITTVNTPFGKTSILVCADAYTYPSTQALDRLKESQPDFVIVFWGITASTKSECGTQGFNAAEYTQRVVSYLNNTAIVVGANATGPRSYGRFLPSVYCGMNGCSTPMSYSTEIMQPSEELMFFHINKGPNESKKLSMSSL